MASLNTSGIARSFSISIFPSRIRERTNEEILKHVFKTTDIGQIAIEIVKRGQIQLTTEQRKEILEENDEVIVETPGGAAYGEKQ